MLENIAVYFLYLLVIPSKRIIVLIFKIKAFFI